MKKNIKIWVILLLLLSYKANAENKAFFWEMISDDGSKSYLMGSIHLGVEDMYPLPNKVMKAFDNSDVLVLEINISDVNPTELMKSALLDDDETLESFISPENFKFFEDYFAEMGLPKMVYNKFKPWFAAMMVSTTSMVSSGYSAQLGIDMYFLNLAGEKSMPIDELETLESQIDVFDSFDIKYSDLIVDFMLNDLKNDESDKTKELFSAFKSGDEKMLEKLISKSMTSDDKNMQELSFRLLDGRNIKMAEKIEQLHSSGKVHFIVAGAAHFIGENGIIDILEKTGKYKIVRK